MIASFRACFAVSRLFGYNALCILPVYETGVPVSKMGS